MKYISPSLSVFLILTLLAIIYTKYLLFDMKYKQIIGNKLGHYKQWKNQIFVPLLQEMLSPTFMFIKM